MLTLKEKSTLRNLLFRYLDGIAIVPTAFALYKQGLLKYIQDHHNVSLNELVLNFEANEGYLNVALRILASQGWINYKIEESDILVQTHDKSDLYFKLVPNFETTINVLNYADEFTNSPLGLDAFRALEKCFKDFKNDFQLPDEDETIFHQIKHNLTGVIAGPLIVMLGMNGLFHKYFMEASFRAQEYHKDPESFAKILDFFTDLGWFTKKKDHYQFTDNGLFYAKRATAYGVTVSYLPTFKNLSELIFGNPAILNSVPDELERHVNREMNVWGSGGAHSTYFKIIDNIIIELFNKPIEEQPKGILDMGCGNGAFIQHIFDIIDQQTLRGKYLDEYPLLLVGADFNQAALKVTRANLIKADIWAKVIWGDIGRPDVLAKDLIEDYGIALEDLLNVRTFLDHNRIWEKPTKVHKSSLSTGAYVSKGKRIPNNYVESSLVEHLKKWKPYVKKFGLLIIELHTLPPEITSSNLGKTAATAYDATHGYSDQYILELDVFQRMAKKADLFPDDRYTSKFPKNELATVSIHLLKEKKLN